MRAVRLAAAIAATLLAIPAGSSAQVSVGPMLVLHDDFDLGLGAAVSSPLPSIGRRTGLLGDLVWFFPDSDEVDAWEINGNLTWDFSVNEPTITPFLLAGIGIAHVSIDDVDVLEDDGPEDTDLGLNLGGGIKFRTGRLEPAVGARIELAGADGFAVFGVLPFRVGS